MEKNFEIIGQLEEGPWGAKTFDLNYPSVPHPLNKAEWDIPNYKNFVNVVYANPPCACWSAIGARLGKADPRLQFTYNSANLALAVEPQFFVVESVCRAWTAGREVYEEIAEQFRQKGYAITFLLTNGILHGSPQSRERFHLIAHKYALPLETPAMPAHMPTVMELIGDLAGTHAWLGEGASSALNHVVRRPTDMEVEVYKRLTASGNYSKIVEELNAAGVPARKGRLLNGRLYADAYSRTLVDLGCVIHPTENRLITLREGARLCTYPDTFEFASDSKNREFGVAATDVTQAVMPAMGAFFSDLFAQAMDNEAPASGTQEIDWRSIARPFTPGRYARTMGWR
jgi:DNA (cytosine-5)-methyltransferase 1